MLPALVLARVRNDSKSGLAIPCVIQQALDEIYNFVLAVPLASCASEFLSLSGPGVLVILAFSGPADFVILSLSGLGAFVTV